MVFRRIARPPRLAGQRLRENEPTYGMRQNGSGHKLITQAVYCEKV
jgi:hypothetical protein